MELRDLPLGGRGRADKARDTDIARFEALMIICRLRSFPYFINRLDSLIAEARAALSFLDKEDLGNFIESFGATLENVESELKRRKRPNYSRRHAPSYVNELRGAR